MNNLDKLRVLRELEGIDQKLGAIDKARRTDLTDALDVHLRERDPIIKRRRVSNS